VEHLGPLAGGVGDHQADAVLLEEGDEIVIHEARMADLDCMAQLAFGVDRQARAPEHP
jgi:hypothetical protein